MEITNRHKVISGSKNKEYWRVGVTFPNGYHCEMLYSRLIVEMTLGKTLPLKAVVHHVDGDSLYDYPSNLVACEDDAYHKLLHQRADALIATGDSHARRCVICKKWGIPGDGDMVVRKRNDRPKGNGISRHKSCHRRDMRRGGDADGTTNQSDA